MKDKTLRRVLAEDLAYGLTYTATRAVITLIYFVWKYRAHTA